MKLKKTMLEYVLDQEHIKNVHDALKYGNCLNYANFLSQPINISMFVPAKLVDGVWAMFDEPKESEFIFKNRPLLFENLLEYYEQAKENVIFEGFELIESDEDFTTILNATNKIKLHFDLKYKEIVFEISNQTGHLTTIESITQFKLNLNTNNKTVNSIFI